MNYSYKSLKTTEAAMNSSNKSYTVNLIKFICLVFVLISFPMGVGAQVEYQNDVDQWHVYNQQNPDILIEYSYQITSPINQFSAKYLVLKITNVSATNKYVSWDFSKVDYKGNCKNCDGSISEWSVNKKLKAGEIITIDVNEMNKNGLKWFVCFEDERYEGSGNQPWQSFELKNLTITTIE